MKLEIKVCGNTEGENLKKVCNLQPDYVGFIFYNKSKRFVESPESVARVEGCKAKRVGVFVNASTDYIKRRVEDFELDIIQLHGDELPEFCQKVNSIRPVFKAFQINDNFTFNNLSNYKSECNKFLFDTSSKMYGGSGKKFDWQLLDRYKSDLPFILSGGIGTEDLEKLQKIDHPMFSGIDLNSRFELVPGIKDIPKLTSFINNIRTL